MKDRIKKIRQQFDLTQQEFADKIGIKRSTIAKYETGTNSPSSAVISLICREFDVNEEWLRDGIGDMFHIINSSHAESVTDTTVFGNTSKMKARIKELRNTLSLTQQEFADKIGISRGNIAAYEVGKNNPSDAVIGLICREFNINEDWLRNGTHNMFQTVQPSLEGSISNAMPSVSSFDMKDRIKKVRKELDLTQQEFADRLCVKRGAIANYEIGRNEPTCAIISLICREFNVSEEWLRYGIGEMFLSAASSCPKYVPCLPDKKNAHDFICLLARMSEAEWDALGWDMFQVMCKMVCDHDSTSKKDRA